MKLTWIALLLFLLVHPSRSEEGPPECEWVFTCGGADSDKVRAIACDGDGNVFLASECGGDTTFGGQARRGAGGVDMVVVKVDSSGKAVWVNGLGGSKTERAYGASLDGAGNLYITGHYESTDIPSGAGFLPNAGSYDVFLAKYSADGRLLWVRTAGGPGYDYGHGLLLDRNGDVIVTGAVKEGAVFGKEAIAGTAGGGNAIFCAKYGPDGELKWLRSSSEVSGSGHGIAVDGANHLYIGGSVAGKGRFGKVEIAAPTQAALVLKLTPEGEALWASVIPGSHGAVYHEIACDSSGRVWGAGMFKGAVSVAGETFESSGEKDYDGLIVRLDPSGAVRWAHTMHGPGTDYCLGVATDESGKGYVCGDFSADTRLAGKALATRGSGDVYLAAFDEAGALLWSLTAGGKNNDSAYPLVFRGRDEIYIGGSLSLPSTFGRHELGGASASDLYVAKWRLPAAP